MRGLQSNNSGRDATNQYYCNEVLKVEVLQFISGDIGLGLRFTSIFCAGYVDFLNDVKLSVSGKRLIIFLKQDMIDLMDFHSERRFQTFAKTLGLQSEIQLVHKQ